MNVKNRLIFILSGIIILLTAIFSVFLSNTICNTTMYNPRKVKSGNMDFNGVNIVDAYAELLGKMLLPHTFDIEADVYTDSVMNFGNYKMQVNMSRYKTNTINIESVPLDSFILKNGKLNKLKHLTNIFDVAPIKESELTNKISEITSIDAQKFYYTFFKLNVPISYEALSEIETAQKFAYNGYSVQWIGVKTSDVFDDVMYGLPCANAKYFSNLANLLNTKTLSNMFYLLTRDEKTIRIMNDLGLFGDITKEDLVSRQKYVDEENVKMTHLMIILPGDEIPNYINRYSVLELVKFIEIH